MRRMNLLPSADPTPLAPSEDTLQKEMETGECYDACQTNPTCVTDREILLSNLVCDRGANPSQGTCCHVSARTVSRHSGPSNEL